MNTIVRFAPSPTGNIHVGNARLALLNWLFAKSNDGKFILRFDDTDTQRSKERFVEGIKRDLSWLGIQWDSELRQSAEMDSYEIVSEKLKSSGLIYPCYETSEELEFKRKRLRAQRKPPIYDRSALLLSESDHKEFEKKGLRPHWRFKLRNKDISWFDLVRGETIYNTANISDPVVIREDGSYLYLLPSVVDDLNCGITHIIRGEDHITNSAVQVEMMQSIMPQRTLTFAHIPLVTGLEGELLSKRTGSLSLEDLRKENIEPLVLMNFLSKMGSSDSIIPEININSIIDQFDLNKISRASPKFNFSELIGLNSKTLQKFSFSQVSSRLIELGADKILVNKKGEAFWHAIRGNIDKFEEAIKWWKICFNKMKTPGLESSLNRFAEDCLPEEPWSEQTWSFWTSKISELTNLKGRSLFLPLRIALTGLEKGPELKVLLPLIGRQEVHRRINAKKE